MIETRMQDFRYAARTFRRSPGFLALTVLTIAIGVGAAAAASGSGGCGRRWSRPRSRFPSSCSSAPA